MLGTVHELRRPSCLLEDRALLHGEGRQRVRLFCSGTTPGDQKVQQAPIGMPGATWHQQTPNHKLLIKQQGFPMQPLTAQSLDNQKTHVTTSFRGDKALVLFGANASAHDKRRHRLVNHTVFEASIFSAMPGRANNQVSETSTKEDRLSQPFRPSPESASDGPVK